MDQISTIVAKQVFAISTLLFNEGLEHYNSGTLILASLISHNLVFKNGFGKNVCNHVISRTIFKQQFIKRDVFPHKMKLNIYVLSV